MADLRHEEPHASPAGLVLHEPTFPDISSTPKEPAPSAELKLKTDSAAPGTSLVETQQSQNQHMIESGAQKVRDDQASQRPTQQRSATERPKPSARHSILNRIQSRAHGTQLNRPTTITFDAESSDSDSSSSDDEHYLKKAPSRHDGLTREESRKRRKATAGPFSRLKITNDHFNSSGRISKSDGRLKLNLLEKDGDKGYLAKTLGAILKKNAPNEEYEKMKSYDKTDVEARKIAPEDDEMEHDPSRRIRLNIVIIIIGSRGDIQPFIRIGKILQNDYGHRVRMATHPAFKDFVEKDSGLEFFSIGGNPAELMAFMVKNPGLIPGFDTIKEGEIGRRRAQMYEMFGGMWRACINATDDEQDETNAKMMGDKFPFIADAIIANPPSFAPPHIAEKLGIPLHMMFTFPYTPTVHFPHPLANIKSSNVEATYGNFMSYPLVELMTWQGLGDLINRFRTTILHLEEVSTIWAPGQLYRLKVPYTYMWSPSLIQKPKDWGPEIDVTGFVFLDLASSFKPPDDLQAFLDKGDPPVYIGFGSIVVDDPDAFTNMIFEAVKIVGCRALVSKGWGGFGSNADCPDNVFMLENTPHDWLFPRCSAVVHHGGAGTTAIGLKTARPTMIVPFFGDQPFWGSMVSKAKAGALECIPYKKLNAERLAEGIKQCLTEEARANVKKIADSIEKEGDGALNAVRSFHRSLPLHGSGSMRCDILANRAAVWKIKKTNVKLSALATEMLVEEQKIKWNDLRLLRHYEYNDFGGAGEPITGVWGAVMSTITDAATGVGGVPIEMSKSVKEREKIRMKKRAIKKRKQTQSSTLARANSPSAKADTENKENTQEKDRRPTTKREESSLSKLEEPEEELAEELANEAGSGFRKTSAAIIRFPMNIGLALTQGFHNAPRLYGDETVRRPPRVTGFHSGLRAGRAELVYGVRDGVTGVVTQPIRMAKQQGVLGAAKGFGFGIGGLVLKDIAAAIGPGAYFLKGLDAEYMKRYQPTKYLRRGRIAQGQLEMQHLGTDKGLPHIETLQDGTETSYPEQKEAVQQTVSVRWQELQEAMEEEKKHRKSGIRGSLFGKGERKEGQRMPRKSKEEPRELQPAKAKTTPIVETDAGRDQTKKKKNKQSSTPKRSMEEGGRGLNRSSTAPITMLERKQGDALRPLDRSQAASGSKAQTQGPTHDNVQAHATGHLPEHQHHFTGTENKYNPDPADVDEESQGFKTPLETPGQLAVEHHMARQVSNDASSENTKVEMPIDENSIDIGKLRKEAEQVGGGGVVDVKV